jgi:hypothetical protein
MGAASMVFESKVARKKRLNDVEAGGAGKERPKRK